MNCNKRSRCCFRLDGFVLRIVDTSAIGTDFTGTKEGAIFHWYYDSEEIIRDSKCCSWHLHLRDCKVTKNWTDSALIHHFAMCAPKPSSDIRIQNAIKETMWNVRDFRRNKFAERSVGDLRSAAQAVCGEIVAAAAHESLRAYGGGAVLRGGAVWRRRPTSRRRARRRRPITLLLILHLHLRFYFLPVDFNLNRTTTETGDTAKEMFFKEFWSL